MKQSAVDALCDEIDDLDDVIYDLEEQLRRSRLKVSALLADRARIWEEAYNKGWANRDAKQGDWSVPDPPNPYKRAT